jgi:integrase
MVKPPSAKVDSLAAKQLKCKPEMGISDIMMAEVLALLLGCVLGLPAPLKALCVPQLAALARYSNFGAELRLSADCYENGTAAQLPLLWRRADEFDASGQHTLGHVDCQACDGARVNSGHFHEYPFAKAMPLFLQARRYRAESTRKLHLDYAAALGRYFGQVRLCDIRIGHLEVYQRSRQAAIRVTAPHRARHGAEHHEWDGASRINHELNLLAQLLRRAGLWAAIEPHYQPMPLPKEGPGIALTEEEERYYFRLARGNPRWLVAYCTSVISRGTSANPGELKGLRVGGVRLDVATPSIVVQEYAKNVFRERVLPLNDEGVAAARLLLERYRKMCDEAGVAPSPDHYLLPHRAKTRGALPDFTRHMHSWKRAHYAIRAEMAKKFPRLARMRHTDWRHTVCTLWLEDPTISYSTIEKMMGHELNSKTKRKYDHMRDPAMRAAANSATIGIADAPAAAADTRKPPQAAAAVASALGRGGFISFGSTTY